MPEMSPPAARAQDPAREAYRRLRHDSEAALLEYLAKGST